MIELSKEYRDLVEKVRKIVPVSADYMLYYALHLPSWTDSGDLKECFLWCETPQGDSLLE